MPHDKIWEESKEGITIQQYSPQVINRMSEQRIQTSVPQQGAPAFEAG